MLIDAYIFIQQRKKNNTINKAFVKVCFIVYIKRTLCT